MSKGKFFINAIFILILVFTTTGNTARVAQAGNGNDEPKADPRLLQMAAENPDAIFMVIVQREIRNNDMQEDDPEADVEKDGGKVKKQFRMVESFSAEMTGKEIIKLAKHKKVRWISADAPMISESARDKATFKAIVTNAPLAVVGTVYTVTSTSNSGTGTLRQAITDANNHAGADTISFNISGTGVHTITPTSALPTITGAVILDATTDNSFAANGSKPAIVLDGNLAGAGIHGLTIQAGNSTVRGLVINRFGGNGIQINGSNNLIAGNWIGLDATGTLKKGNGVDGITISANNNTIGGTNTADRNVISGNGDEGVDIDPGFTGNVIIGNYIGTNASGMAGIGNGTSGNSGGILIDGSNTRVGGINPGEGNLIAYNNPYGIFLGTTPVGASILGNSISSNGSLGIDLNANGVTANNGTKSSSLPNYDMDYPVITSASLSSCNGLTVAGYVGSTANQSAFANARVEFFKAAVDTSGYGEGQTFQGYLTTDSSGNFNGILAGTGFMSGDQLTATATDTSNNTSEFGANFQVTTTGSCITSPFTGVVRADQLWSTLTGQGVTVAVVDSGITTQHPDFSVSSTNTNSRIIASTKFGNNLTTADMYGHGTHVAGIIGGNGSASNGLYKGMAPGVNLINIKTSDAYGMTYESDLVDALQWIYNNKTTYNIRAVNISMNSTVAQSYHTSPLDAAVEILWFNGIVVVVSAGNNGTTAGPSTLYPPANDPFVITVGATEDKGTVSLGDDNLAVFSAYGATEDGFAKPDLVAPGRNVIAPLGGLLNIIFGLHPLNRVNDYYFRMSGTSMSAPVVSGAVALLLQDEPNLTPDQVKYRLMATANQSWLGYTSSKTGAGYLDVYAAVNGTSTQTANTGITVSNMLTTGSSPVTWGSVGWNSVGWNSVGWNSVGWNSVGWNSVGWNSVGWNASLWDQ